MSGPYSFRDVFETPKGVEPLICPDPESCQEFHNEADPATNEEHHYGCECGWGTYVMWTME